MTRRDLLLAVDGGGTKTQALVSDLEGHVLARGLGLSSNLHNVGFERFAQAITTAIDGALLHVLGPSRDGASESWRSGRIAAACFGLAGVDSDEDEARISRWVSEQQIAPTFTVVNDAELILAGGTPEGWGVALISGTGSVCLGRSREGRTFRVGGWGSLIGDEGSGYDIAIRALHLATQTADGRAQAHGLLKAALRHWNVADVHALMRYVHAPDTDPPDIAGFAAAVLNLCTHGDEAARKLVDDAAADLAHQVRVVVGTLGLKRPPLAVGGGLLRAQLRHAVTTALGDDVGAVSYVADPVLGAVELSRRLLKTSPVPHA
jgi:N-acetylglucosamine kinase-like BadF-type ATPase